MCRVNARALSARFARALSARFARAASPLLVAALAALAAPGAATAAPRFVPGPCWFTVPDGEAALCGTVAVPDYRDRPATRAFRLPVVVLLSTAAKPEPDPILYLEGGPGASPFGGGDAVEERMEVWWDLTAAFRRSRNVILFDPRGVGRAEPDTDCPELDVLGVQPNPAPVPEAKRDALERKALSVCAGRFKAQGLDGAMFTSPVAADDALDVASALGAQKVNLFAVSYGTRVALDLMRRHGDRVRGAVLDSVYPPDVNALEEAPWLASRAMKRLFDDCAANRGCRAAHPELERRFLELLDRLQRTPADVSVGDDDVPRTVRLDGAAALSAMLEAMATGDSVANLPTMIDRASHGRYDRLASWVPDAWIGDPDTAEGVAFSIECRETVNPADRDKLAESMQRYAPYGLVLRGDPSRRICSVWPAAAQEPQERLPVASPVPVLLLAGAYDPLTPPEWAERAAATLPKSRVLTFRGAGHQVTSGEDCAVAAAALFVESGTLAADVCPGASKPPPFEGP